MPSASSDGSAPPSSATTGAAGSTNREIIDADQMKVATLSTKTAGTLATPRSRAPIAGPRKKDRLSSVLATPLAAVSSWGVFTSEGRIACCAGRKGAPTRPAITAMTNTALGGPDTQMITAARPTSTARIRSVPIMNRLRGSRSISTELNGSTTADRPSRATTYAATAVAPP